MSRLLSSLLMPREESQSRREPLSVIKFYYFCYLYTILSFPSFWLLMFESKQKVRGIVRNKTEEFNLLKGRKKTPIKRYCCHNVASPNQPWGKPVFHWLFSRGRKSYQVQSSFRGNPTFWNRNGLHSGTGLDGQLQRLLLFAEGSRIHTYLSYEEEGEIGKENLKKMTAVREDKHVRVIQQFTEEATAVRAQWFRN